MSALSEHMHELGGSWGDLSGYWEKSGFGGEIIALCAFVAVDDWHFRLYFAMRPEVREREARNIRPSLKCVEQFIYSFYKEKWQIVLLVGHVIGASVDQWYLMPVERITYSYAKGLEATGKRKGH